MFDRAEYAFKPKDIRLNRKISSPESAAKLTENEIKERINRLSQIFSNKVWFWIKFLHWVIMLCITILWALLSWIITGICQQQAVRQFSWCHISGLNNANQIKVLRWLGSLSRKFFSDFLVGFVCKIIFGSYSNWFIYQFM